MGWEQFERSRLSIPLDYHLKFHVNQDSKRSVKVYSLQEIIQKYSLPMTVEYTGQEVSRKEKSGPVFASRSFRLRLLEIYDDIYLLGNLLTETHLYERTIEIPLYLKTVRLSLIHGVNDPSVNWSKFLEMVDTRVNNCVKFDSGFGNPDIAVYQENDKGEEDYCYLTPSKYTTINKHGGNDHFYTKMSFSLNRSSNSYSILARGNTEESLTSIDGIHSRYNNVSSAPKLTNKEGRQLGRSNVEEESPPPLPPRAGSLSIVAKPLSVRKDEQRISMEHRQPLIRNDTTVTFIGVSSGSTKSSETRKQQIKEDVLVRGHIDKDGHLYSEIELKSDSGEPNQRHARVTTDIPKTRNESEVHAVFVTKEKHLSDPSKTSSLGKCGISLEQEQIKKMTVSEVCEWLDVLKLSKYKEVFEENMIDGFLLTELSDDMIRYEIGMSRFEALKLTKFARECHIPKP